MVRKSKTVQKVQLVKKRRKRRGPKVTKILKDRTVAKLRYVDLVSINAAGAGIAKHTFRANSIFDPDETSTGHQPLMHDEYALLYGSYRVLSSKIRVSPVNDTSSNVNPMLYGVYRDYDTTLTYAQGTSIIEDMRNKGSWGFAGSSATLQPYVQTLAARSTSFNGNKHLSPEGRNNAILMGSNPSTGTFDAYYQVWASSLSATDPGAMLFLVQIDYIVEFTDPIVVTPS